MSPAARRAASARRSSEVTGESYVQTNRLFQRYFLFPMHTYLRSLTMLLVAAPLADTAAPTVTTQASGTTQRLQAVSPVTDQIVWASGTGGTYVKTTDGGDHWRAGVVPGADSLEFRDVAAMDSMNAWLLAAGPGPASRIYRTNDGGATWAQQFVNTDSAAFFDCFAFWDASHGIAVSDGVRGHFPILVTDDGGTHWTLRPTGESPAADSGEGAFAASGTCIVTGPGGRAWIGTGASPTGGGRVVATTDFGKTWASQQTPIQHGTTTTGIGSLAYRDATHAFAGGGDINPRAPQTVRVARTDDGGKTWVPITPPGFAGGVYGLAAVPGTEGLVAVGPGGAAYSPDGRTVWLPLDSVSYWSAGFASAHAGWMVGPKGRIARIQVR